MNHTLMLDGPLGEALRVSQPRAYACLKETGTTFLTLVKLGGSWMRLATKLAKADVPEQYRDAFGVHLPGEYATVTLDYKFVVQEKGDTRE